MERQTRVNVRSASAVVLFSIAAAACGSSDPASGPSDTSGEAVPPELTSEFEEPLERAETEAINSEGGATSAEQLEGRWYLVAVDGVELDPAEGDFWVFLGAGTQLEITGFDGCNGFGTAGSSRLPATALVDSRLENVEIGSDEMDCPGVEYGPFPETGALLTVSDDGATLTSDGPSATIEFSRTSPAETSSQQDQAPQVDPPIATSS